MQVKTAGCVLLGQAMQHFSWEGFRLPLGRRRAQCRPPDVGCAWPQHLLGSAAQGQAFFVRAAVHTGVVGLLAAFAAGYAVYGAGLLAATIALKWVLVGRMPAGEHKCAAPALPPADLAPRRRVIQVAFFDTFHIGPSGLLI